MGWKFSCYLPQTAPFSRLQFQAHRWVFIMPRRSVLRAADLVHLLTMAHQELPLALVSLAKKDGRFQQGAGRGRGSGGRGRGGRRRQVGGAGLGFQAEDADAAAREQTACAVVVQSVLPSAAQWCVRRAWSHNVVQRVQSLQP